MVVLWGLKGRNAAKGRGEADEKPWNSQDFNGFCGNGRSKRPEQHPWMRLEGGRRWHRRHTYSGDIARRMVSDNIGSRGLLEPGVELSRVFPRRNGIGKSRGGFAGETCLAFKPRWERSCSHNECGPSVVRPDPIIGERCRLLLVSNYCLAMEGNQRGDIPPPGPQRPPKRKSGRVIRLVST